MGFRHGRRGAAASEVSCCEFHSLQASAMAITCTLEPAFAEAPADPLPSTNQTPHPLSRYLRFLKATFILLILFSSASILLLFLAPLSFFFLRLFSLRWSRSVTSRIFGQWLGMWPFFFEKINKTRVVVSGQKVPEGERVILICNHRTEVDWMYIWNLALRKKRIGNVKYVLKSSVKNAPVFGWAFHVLEFLPIYRKWQVDAPIFDSMLSSFTDRRDPLWLIIFPEGTDYTGEKCLRSQRFAEANDLPKLHNVLLPRAKGFYSCLSHLRDSIDAVYDVTIGYKTQCPLFIDNALGTDPKEVHIHMKRIPIQEIPSTEPEVATWLINEFSWKDKLLDAFYKDGRFSDSGSIEEELDMATGIFNVCMVILASTVLLVVMLSSFLWVKVYVAFSCVFLTAATYLNYKPLPVLKI